MEKASDVNLAAEKFAQLLEMVNQKYPNLGNILLTALESRANNLACHLGDALHQSIPGAYLRGIEEIFGHLDSLFHAFENEPILRNIACLVRRACAIVRITEIR